MTQIKTGIIQTRSGHNVRAPSETEMILLIDKIGEVNQEPFRKAYFLLQQYPVVVIDNYTSDGPGYQGPVFVMIHGEPNFISVFTLQDDGDGEYMEDVDINEHTAQVTLFKNEILGLTDALARAKAEEATDGEA